MLRVTDCVPSRHKGLRVVSVEYEEVDGYTAFGGGGYLCKDNCTGVTNEPDRATRFAVEEAHGALCCLSGRGLKKLETHPVGLWCLSGEEYHEVASNLAERMHCEWREDGSVCVDGETYALMNAPGEMGVLVYRWHARKGEYERILRNTLCDDVSDAFCELAVWILDHANV